MKKGFVQTYTGSGKNKCVKYDTVVFSSQGITAIETFGEAKAKFFGRYEKTYVNDLHGDVRNITGFYNNGVSPCYKLTTQDGYNIECTNEHKFLTIDSKTADLRWSSLKELSVGQYVALARGDNTFGEGELDLDIAKFIGLCIADGSRNYSPSGKLGLIIQTKDNDTIEFINKIKDKYECAYSSCISARGLHVFSWYNAGKWLIDSYGFDISNKTCAKYIPDIIMRGNRETVLSFMQGLFTDISTCGRHQILIEFSTGSSMLCNQVRQILMNFGIKTCYKPKYVSIKRNPEGELYHRLKISAEDVYTFNDIFKLPKITAYLENHPKKDKRSNTNTDIIPIKEYMVSKISSHKYNTECYELLRNCRFLKTGVGHEKLDKYYSITHDEDVAHLVGNRYSWQKIKSIEYSGDFQTYDISIENTESYVANCFVTHNTTSAFGLVFRGFGKGFNILLTQFLKGDEAWDYGEIKSCEKFKDQITIIQSGKKKIVMENNKDEKDKQLATKAFDEMEDLLFKNNYNLLVLDEILPALNLQLITQKRFFEFVQRCRDELPSLEIVLTGRMWSDSLYDKIKDISDLMTDGRCVKHYFDKHCTTCKRSFEYRSNYCPNCGRELETVNARDGIEF